MTEFIEKKQADRIAELNKRLLDIEAKLEKTKTALNRIGILGDSGMAYTKDFTTETVGIVREVLCGLREG